MILGHVRDHLPRLSLSLPGLAGSLSVEFIVDTGFDGELALPGFLLRELDVAYVGDHPILLADGTERARPAYRTRLDWQGRLRSTEIMLLEGVPLLGVQLLAQNHLQVEMTDGGEVIVEPL